MTKAVVHSVLPGMDRSEIHATTGQMRNFYQQFGDGYFSVLDVMNYMQHHAIVKMVRPGDHLLDMCCGRGLLLPMLRYYAKELGSYTGVDITQTNATFRTKRVHDGKPLGSGYYPFPVYFALSDVAEMTKKLPKDRYNLIVYTSSLEHMHPDNGLKSLYQAYEVAASGATMVLTCPNTPEGADGFDTQYSYHIYEWKRSEVEKALKEVGWKLTDVFGLLINVSDLRPLLTPELQKAFDFQSQYIPREWLTPMYAALFPEASKELAYICTK